MRVLVVYHSLSGETNSIIGEFCKGLKDGMESEKQVSVEFVKQPIATTPPFPFPWKSLFAFFDCMPETVSKTVRKKKFENSRDVVPPPPALSLPPSKKQPFDLIILGWQTWFLSPSLPISLALSDHSYQNLLRDAPVLLLGTHRNMWHRASGTLKKGLSKCNIVGRVDFVQPSAFLKSVTNTLKWQLQGEIQDGGATKSQGAAREAGRELARLRNRGGKWPRDFQAGAPYNPTVARLEAIFFPVKYAFAQLMGLFPPGSLLRKIVTVLYVPVLLGVIVTLAAPILAVGALIGNRDDEALAFHND